MLFGMSQGDPALCLPPIGYTFIYTFTNADEGNIREVRSAFVNHFLRDDIRTTEELLKLVAGLSGNGKLTYPFQYKKAAGTAALLFLFDGDQFPYLWILGTADMFDRFH